MPGSAKSSPWERRKGETEDAHALFLLYRDMGDSRSLAAVREKRGQSVGKAPAIRSLEDLSGRHKWVDRARAWDNHIQAAKDAEAAKEAAKWERRRLKEIEDVYQRGEELCVLVDQALKFPLASRVVEQVKKGSDGKTIEIVTVEPARWTLRDVAAIWELATRLKAGALAAMSRDPSMMSDAELAAVGRVSEGGI